MEKSVPKKSVVKKALHPKKFWGNKIVGSTKFFVPKISRYQSKKIFLGNKFWGKNNLGLKNLGPVYFWLKKMGSQKYWSKQFWVKKKYGPKRF